MKRPSPSTVVLVVLAVGVAVFLGWVVQRQPGSAAYTGPQPTVAPPTVGPPALRVAALGDSMIENANSWYRQWVAATAGVADVGNFGVGGQDTAHIAARVDAALGKKPQVLIVEGGTNDTLSAIPPDETVANLDHILVAAKRAGVRGVLVGIPPSDERAPLVQPLNAALRALAGRDGIPFVDVFAAVGQSDGTWKPGLSSDKRHPNDEGARLMTQEARGELAVALHLATPVSSGR